MPSLSDVRTERRYLFFLALFGLTFLVLIPVVLIIRTTPFNGLYGQDPYAYIDYSLGPLLDNLKELKLPPPFFWPPGYPLLVAATSLLVGPIALAGQIVSLLAGAMIPLFTALLALEIWSERGQEEDLHSIPIVPFLAGALIAFSGQIWQSSAVVMADTTGLVTATLGAWSLARYGRLLPVRGNRALPWLLLAAGALAYAILSRWAYALVAIPMTIYALLMLVRQPPRSAILQATLAGIVVTLVLIPVWNSFLPGVFVSQSGHAGFLGDLQVYHWDIREAFRRIHQTTDGVLQYSLPNGLYYALTPAHKYLFTPLVALALPFGIWQAWRERSTAILTFLFFWPAVVYLFHAGTPWQNLRFTLAYLPPLAILAALGINWIFQAFNRIGRLVVLGAFIASLVLMASGGWSLTVGLINRQAGELATVRWAEARIPMEARVLTFGISLTFEHNSPIEVKDLFNMTPDDLDRFLLAGAETYLLLDVENIETQWAGLSPDLAWEHLQETPGINPIGDFRNYTLFKIKEVRP